MKTLNNIVTVASYFINNNRLFYVERNLVLSLIMVII